MDKIIPIKAFNDNYIWLLINSNTKTAVCVDPGDAKPVLATLEELSLNLSAILVTHHHYDHCGGVVALLKHYSVPVYAPAKETVSGATKRVQQGTEVNLPEINIQFQVLDIPAHTAGHIAFYDEQMIFCGDTLFTGGCGRLFEGTAAEMHNSLQKICRLPDNAKIYCGHEYTEANLRFAITVEPNNLALQQRIEEVRHQRSLDQATVPATLAVEKATNPFLRCSEASVIQAAEDYSGKKLDGPAEVLAVIRQWKDQF